MFKSKGSPKIYLDALCKHLESKPDEFAKQSLTLIRDALANDGKINLRRKIGRPPVPERKLERACEVANLRIQKNKLRIDAIKDVAKNHGLKFDTVEKDYKIYGKYARSLAKFVASGPRTKRRAAELESLLGTFTHDDGARLLTQAESKKIAGSVPIQSLVDLIDAIQNGPLRSDAEFLNELLSPIRECGYLIPPV